MKKKYKIDGHGNVSIFYMMKTRFFLNPNMPLYTVLLLASACAPQLTPTPFRPPTLIGPTQILSTTTPVPQLFTPIPTPTVTSTVAGPCSNDLAFIDDLTIDDGTSFAPGASLDKQWRVQNSGSCNWDSTYRIKWIGGDPLGAAQEQPLFPAKAGAQATLRILFTAPSAEGYYESSWQAIDSNGNIFGDPIYIKIAVAAQL